MKLLFFGSRMDLISGHSRPAYELASELIKRGHDVRILSTQLSPERQARHEELLAQESHLGALPTERILRSPADLLRPSRADLEEILAWPDLIHCFSFWSSLLLLHLKNIRTPAILTLNTDPFRPKKRDLTGPTEPIWASGRRRTWISTLMPQRLVRRWLAPFDCFLAWTQFLEQKFEGIGVPAQKIHRTTLGLNPERFPEVAAKSVGDPIFYFFGLLTPGRGALDAVEAFALVQDQLPSAKLVIADRQHQLVRDRSYLGAKRVELGERLKALGLQDNVIIRGFVPNVLGSMREADVVVLPFRSSAGYSQPPLTVLESLALGLPVVSSNVGCISEVVPPPPHGFLVEPRSPAQLAEAMITAWRTDSDSLRLERRQHILAKFSWPRSVDFIEAEYSILANSK